MQQTVGGEAAGLKDLYLSVSRFARELDPNVVSGADATLLHNYASRLEGVAATIKALALLRIDETDAYKTSGHRSAADYGASKTGTSPSDALRGMKRAKNARRLPHTEEAMRNGDISAQQADAITDAARINPDAEADLLKSARTDDLGTLKRKARRAKSSADPDLEARNQRIHNRRSLKHWTNEDGEFHAHLTTTPEAGARFLAGLEPHRKAAFEHARKTGRHQTADAYAADALDALARGNTPEPARPTAGGAEPAEDRAPTHDSTNAPSTNATGGRPNHGATRRAGKTTPSEAPAARPTGAGHDDVIDLTDGATRGNEPPHSGPPPTGSPPSGSRPSGSPPSGSPPGAGQPVAPATPAARPPTAVHLNLDFAPLVRGHLQPGDTCEIPGIGPISLSAARALLTDAIVELILKKGDDIRSVVHYGRTVTADQRRALEARDPCCIRPGCGHNQNLEIDHRDGWAITHQTTLDELGRLCPSCHDLKTHHGHTYSGGPGTWKWHVPGDGLSDDHAVETDDQNDTLDGRESRAEQVHLFGGPT